MIRYIYCKLAGREYFRSKVPELSAVNGMMDGLIDTVVLAPLLAYFITNYCSQ